VTDLTNWLTKKQKFLAPASHQLPVSKRGNSAWAGAGFWRYSVAPQGAGAQEEKKPKEVKRQVKRYGI
jgi:hypothetical protein